MAEAAKKLLSYQDYLELEAETGERWEFHAGFAWAMAGGTITHAFLASRMVVLLGRQLLGRPCQPAGSDLKLRIPTVDRAYYPDVSVICGPPITDAQDPNAVLNPTVLVEVLSASTEKDDRITKFEHYRAIPGLRHYVLVSTRLRQVEVRSLRPEGDWSSVTYGPGDRLRLPSVDAEIGLDELYEGVTLDP